MDAYPQEAENRTTCLTMRNNDKCPLAQRVAYLEGEIKRLEVLEKETEYRRQVIEDVDVCGKDNHP
jgi:hypothetical protein